MLTLSGCLVLRQGGSAWITGAALGAVFAMRTLLSSRHVVAFPPIPRPKLFRAKREVFAGAWRHIQALCRAHSAGKHMYAVLPK